VRHRTEPLWNWTYLPPLLHELLTAHRIELVDRCKQTAAKRLAPAPAPDGLQYGVPLFLDQIIKTLQIEQTADPMQSRRVSGPSGGGPSTSEVRAAATLHGRALLKGGYTVDQVVHDYGDLCQAIMELASEHDALISVDEFRALNRCLDNGIADAVTAFASQRDSIMVAQSISLLQERLGFLAHDLRDHLNAATLAVAAIKMGSVGLKGATGAVLDRSLRKMRRRIDRAFAELRATAGQPDPRATVCVADFVAKVGASALLEALAVECTFNVGDVDKSLTIDVDSDTLSSAVANLLHNAFKFTKPHTEVSLNVRSTGDRVLIEVADRCGGLPPAAPEDLFGPFTQYDANRAGLGLGLSICRRNVEANNGVVRVRDIPGFGCVFTIDLPLHLTPGREPTVD
jgi:signal transduction histidine kinase